MRDNWIDLLLLGVITGAMVWVVVTIIGFWAEPSEVIGTAFYKLMN